jgi:hypothetical protein
MTGAGFCERCPQAHWGDIGLADSIKDGRGRRLPWSLAIGLWSPQRFTIALLPDSASAYKCRRRDAAGLGDAGPFMADDLGGYFLLDGTASPTRAGSSWIKASVTRLEVSLVLTVAVSLAGTSN